MDVPHMFQRARRTKHANLSIPCPTHLAYLLLLENSRYSRSKVWRLKIQTIVPAMKTPDFQYQNLAIYSASCQILRVLEPWKTKTSTAQASPTNSTWNPNTRVCQMHVPLQIKTREVVAINSWHFKRSAIGECATTDEPVRDRVRVFRLRVQLPAIYLNILALISICGIVRYIFSPF